MPSSNPPSTAANCRVPVQVPYAQQETDYFCGPACEQMILAAMSGVRWRQPMLYCLGQRESSDPAWYTTPLALERVLNLLKPAGCAAKFQLHLMPTAEKATQALESSGGAGIAAVYRGYHYVVVNIAFADGYVMITDPSRRNSSGHGQKKHRMVSRREWLRTYMLPIRVDGPWDRSYAVVTGSEHAAVPPQPAAAAVRTVAAALDGDAGGSPGAKEPVRGSRLSDEEFAAIRRKLAAGPLLRAAAALREFVPPAPMPDGPAVSLPSIVVRCPGTGDGEYRLYSDTLPVGDGTGYTMHVRYPNFHFTDALTGADLTPISEMAMRSGVSPLFKPGSPLRMSDDELLDAVRVSGRGVPAFWRAALRRARRTPDSRDDPKAAPKSDAGGEVKVYPKAWWKLCEESRDPMEPFRVLMLGRRRLYVREDFAVFESLTSTLPVNRP